MAGRRLRTGQGGFTLIELLITIVIAVVLAALAAPSFNKVIALQRVKSAATDLHLALVRTRSEAVKRNPSGTISVALKPVTSGDWAAGGWQVQVIDTSGSGTTTIVQSFDAPKSVTVTSSGSLSSVVYNGAGRATTGSGTNFTVASSQTDKQMCVYIGSSGMPSVQLRSTGVTC